MGCSLAARHRPTSGVTLEGSPRFTEYRSHLVDGTEMGGVRGEVTGLPGILVVVVELGALLGPLDEAVTIGPNALRHEPSAVGAHLAERGGRPFAGGVGI